MEPDKRYHQSNKTNKAPDDMTFKLEYDTLYAVFALKKFLESTCLRFLHTNCTDEILFSDVNSPKKFSHDYLYMSKDVLL